MAQIVTKLIEDLAVSTAKIAANAVTSGKLASDAVTSSAIAADAIVTAKIAADAVTGAKIKLLNNTFLRSRNAANSADVNMLKVNASDVIEFASLPQAAGTPSAANDLINKAYADTLSGAVSSVNSQTGVVVLDSDDIGEGSTNLYFTQLRARTAAVADSITDGVTDVAPSQNAVFDALALKVNSSLLGANNGVATLDGSGKVPASQLTVSAMEYKGTWNASTNSPTLADGSGSAGDVYVVSVAGTQDLGSGNITFAVGDWALYNGTIWQKTVNSNAVSSVNSQTGVVVLTTDDVAEGSANKYQKTPTKASFTLSAGDITNQYIDLAHTIVASSLVFVYGGLTHTEGVDYTVSLTGGAGGVTRVTFAGQLATAGAAALISGDVLRLQYLR